MIVTKQMRRAVARMKCGPCLAFDIGEAAGVKGRSLTNRIGREGGNDPAREHVGRVGARIAERLKAAGLARSITRRGLTVYGLTRAGDAVET